MHTRPPYVCIRAEIGIFLEEPFSVLALEYLIASCASTIRQLLKADATIVSNLESQGLK